MSNASCLAERNGMSSMAAPPHGPAFKPASCYSETRSSPWRKSRAGESLARLGTQQRVEQVHEHVDGDVRRGRDEREREQGRVILVLHRGHGVEPETRPREDRL